MKLKPKRSFSWPLPLLALTLAGSPAVPSAGAHYLGDTQALEVAVKMADYFERRLETGLILRQEGDLTRGEPLRFTVLKAGSQSAALNLRIPHWISEPPVLTLNGKELTGAGTPSTYVSLQREWEQGDVLALTLAAALRTERAKDDASMLSVFWGPLLLAGELGRENLPNDVADKDAHLTMPPAAVPEVSSTSANPADWLKPIGGAALAFRAHDAGPATGITFRPLFEVHHQRYSVYWTFDENRTGAND